MSIDINWETITSGPDGEALAESIRAFIHDKFQQVTLPGFIRSVQVHSFNFGKVCPELEIKDIGDPLPDFYEDDDGDEDGEGDPKGTEDISEYQTTDQSLHRQEDQSHPHTSAGEQVNAASIHKASQPHKVPSQINTNLHACSPFTFNEPLESPFPRSATPGIPGGTSNLSYFHLPLGGLSGTQTPLADLAAARQSRDAQPYAQLQASSAHQSQQNYVENDNSRPSTAASLLTLQSTIPDGTNGQPSATISPHLHTSTRIPDLLSLKRQHQQPLDPNQPSSYENRPIINPHSRLPSAPAPSPASSDLQLLTHVKYAGDICLVLTAEILLDYPMLSFVGIPLKLSITGVRFEGVAVVAWIGTANGKGRENEKEGKREGSLKFCFLGEEDAEMLVGRSPDTSAELDGDLGEQKAKAKGKVGAGGLLEEIKVESEIGRKENGKQVLKNVGKVERFVLEQVRRIFEEEFVWPSFWTFLV
jgi:mitochondrial distribution and morphology protein 12